MNIFSPAKSSRFDSNHPIKEQVLQSANWFIKLRWAATAGMAAGGGAAYLLSYDISIPWIAGLTVYLLAANAALLSASRFFIGKEAQGFSIRVFTNFQIFIDWLAVLGLIHITGGVDSPFVFFFFFHIVMASILLPAQNMYVNATIAVFFISAVFFLEFAGAISHYSISGGAGDAYSSAKYVFAYIASFAIAVYFTVFLSSFVSELLRRRLRELFEATRSLEYAGARLEAIYKVMGLVGASLDFNRLTKEMAVQAAKLMGIKGAFIALSDKNEKKCAAASQHGLSEEGMPKRMLFMERGEIAARLAANETVFIDDVSRYPQTGDFEAFAWLSSQGIKSLLIAPLSADGTGIGGFCLCSNFEKRFEEEDGDYFRLFCDIAAVQIELARMNELLKLHNETRAWFYRKAAHDLRSPLAAAKSMLDLVTGGFVDDCGKMRELNERISGRIKGLSEMVDDLLLLAQDRLDSALDAKENVDAAAAAKNAYEMFLPLAEKKKIAFSFESSEDAPKAYASRDAIARIINNLVSNAIKYTPEGGSASIAIAEAGGRLEIKISDTGIGVPEESRKYLFHEFFRAPNAKKSSEPGTGLGLTIVKKLAEENGGTVEYAPNEPKGSVFTVSFPAVRKQD